jgi:predicted acylesterase/phospholipase RssA
VANETVTAPAAAEPDVFGEQFEFQDIFRVEADVINRRRRLAHDARGDLVLEKEAKDMDGRPVLRPNSNAGLVGLALSGGGIRSAAFCLGALQALNKNNVLDRVDYLSTVSGGGYIGCSLTAAQQGGAERGYPGFPFASGLREDEPLALQHLRDNSNYLFPNHSSGVDLLRNASIYARGLVVNAVLLIPFLLGASVVTLLCYAARNAFTHLPIINPFGLQYFFLSLDLFLLLVAAGVYWGIFQSTQSQQRKTEIPGWPASSIGWVIITLFFVVFCELQPVILDSMLSGSLAATVSGWVKAVSALLAAISAVFAYFSAKLGEYLKSAMQSTSVKTQAAGIAMKAAIVVGGLVLPVLLWVLYLTVTYWGICINTANSSCTVPSWLTTAASVSCGATILYFAVALFCLVLSLLMQPNANSLHPLYRDRLSKAFFFRPWPVPPTPAQATSRPWPVNPAQPDLVEEWRPKLSEITGLDGPYHLINTALNVEASKVANRRGRNADFFMFSPKFVGSKSTNYVRTSDLEEVATGLTLATAMAASGAAVSSNMGAETIKPLTATLALLNVRLGCWLRNPAKVRAAKTGQGDKVKFDRRNLLANYYFIAEILGLLSEKRKSVYLTDGGHIENLGIYELLRRRCEVIIAVDAEADPQMAFGSFNILERYALIDMGVRIDLPWQQITKMSLTTGEAFDDKGDAPKNNGPHCAVGEISYPDGRKGVLVYIKASLTGDENDAVIDYKKRYDDFPHETTLDQMFTEEQFEAYRALGFHAANNLFDRSDAFARLDPATNPTVRPAFALLDRLFPRAAQQAPRETTTFTATLPRQSPETDPTG